MGWWILAVFAAFMLGVILRNRAVDAARAGEASAKNELRAFRNVVGGEYEKLKAGGTHALDKIFHSHRKQG